MEGIIVVSNPLVKFCDMARHLEPVYGHVLSPLILVRVRFSFMRRNIELFRVVRAK